MGSEHKRRIKRCYSHYAGNQLARAPPSPGLEIMWRAERREQRVNSKLLKPERPSPYTPAAAKKWAWQSPVPVRRNGTPYAQDVWFTRARIRVGLRPVSISL